MSLSKILGLKPPKPPPPPPTVDEAAAKIQQTDRLRRRRGVMANVYAANAAPPVTGKTTLGG